MVFVLYAGTALLLLVLAHRYVRAISWAAALVLFALPLGITGYAVATGGVYGPIDYPYASEPLQALKPLYGIGTPHNASATDVYAQFFPWRRTVQESWRRGEWPLWNPYMLCGHLLAAAVQSAPYSPFTLIACMLPAAVSFTYTASIALFLAALGAFLFARELDCSETAALVAAAGWAFASSTILYIETAMGFTSVYEPMLLLAARRVARVPRISSAVLLAIVLALMILAGHPETLFLAVVAGGAFGIFELVRARRNPLRAMAFAVAGGVLALLLCAIQLLPFLEAMSQSAELEIKRKYWPIEPRSLTNDRVLAVIATDLFPHLHVRRWVRPDFGLTQAETAACGSIILALAVYAVWRRRSPETGFFAAMALVCIAVESRWDPLVRVMQKIPLMSITHDERLAFTAALSLCVLAALAVDKIEFRSAAITFTAVLIVLAAGTWWLAHHVTLAITFADFGHYTPFAELFFLGIAALLLALRVRIAIPALLVLLVAQRVISESDVFKTFPKEAAYPHVAIFDVLKGQREPFRIVGASFALIPGTSAFYGLEDARGFEALHYLLFVRTWPMWCEFQLVWFNRVDNINVPFLSMVNVRYAITSDRAPVPDGWTRIAQQRGAALLENSRALDRIFIPRRVKLGQTLEQQLDEMKTQQDFGDVAWLTANVKPYERDNGPGRITLRVHSRGGTYRFDADMERDGWAVISDTAWNGWRAYVDGHRVEMQRANAAFLAVHIPEGHHDVRVIYWPQSFVRGRAITFATLIGLMAFAISRKVKAARRPSA